MRILLDLAWIVSGFLKFGGLALALVGVLIFGWYFVRANARAAQRDAGEDASVAWGGSGALLGVKVVGLGLAIQLAAFALRLLLPGRM